MSGTHILPVFRCCLAWRSFWAPVVKKQRCFWKNIVPAALFFIKQNPPETQAKNSPGDDGSDKAQQGLLPADGGVVKRQYLYFPGTQTQSLTAMGPEPGIKEEADNEQVNGIKNLTGSECLAIINRQQQRRCDKKEGNQQQ